MTSLLATQSFPDPSPAEVLDAMRTAMAKMRVEDPMTVAHTLKGGLEALDRHGWATGQLMTNAGRVCAVGAIVVAADAIPQFNNGTSPVDMMRHPVIGPAVMALAAATGYNDAQHAAMMKGWNTPPDWTAGDDLVPALHWVTSWNDATSAEVQLIFAKDVNPNSVAAAVPFTAHKQVRSEAEVIDLFAKAIAVLEVL
jgi:hypothetical protein